MDRYDYHVLNALADSPGHRLQLTPLAARIGWELSRASHHVQRMSRRSLVERAPSTADGRATHVVLTAVGRRALLAATPAHADLVRTMFIDGLDPELLEPLRIALEQIHAQVLANGSLPDPGPPQHRLAGMATSDLAEGDRLAHADASDE
jgi:DNA-binding MarR family transcriptional regulator